MSVEELIKKRAFELAGLDFEKLGASEVRIGGGLRSIDEILENVKAQHFFCAERPIATDVETVDVPITEIEVEKALDGCTPADCAKMMGLVKICGPSSVDVTVIRKYVRNVPFDELDDENRELIEIGLARYLSTAFLPRDENGWPIPVPEESAAFERRSALEEEYACRMLVLRNGEPYDKEARINWKWRPRRVA